MSDDNSARWTVTVSKDTDLALRTFLGGQGMRKGDLSKFIEDAVRWRMFDLTAQEVKTRHAGIPPEDLQAAIDEAWPPRAWNSGPCRTNLKNRTKRIVRLVVDTQVLLSALITKTRLPTGFMKPGGMATSDWCRVSSSSRRSAASSAAPASSCGYGRPKPAAWSTICEALPSWFGFRPPSMSRVIRTTTIFSPWPKRVRPMLL